MLILITSSTLYNSYSFHPDLNIFEDPGLPRGWEEIPEAQVSRRSPEPSVMLHSTKAFGLFYF